MVLVALEDQGLEQQVRAQIQALKVRRPEVLEAVRGAAEWLAAERAAAPARLEAGIFSRC